VKKIKFLCVAVLLIVAMSMLVGCNRGDDTPAPAPQPTPPATTPTTPTPPQTVPEAAPAVIEDGLLVMSHVRVPAMAGYTPVMPAGEDVTITIGVQSVITADDHDTNWLTLHMQELTGVNLEFDVFPAAADEARTRFTLMVTAGSDLPDVMLVPFNDEQVWELTQAGVFIPTTEWWNDPTIAPNVWDIDPADREHIFRSLSMYSGNIYSLPSWLAAEWDVGIGRAWMNHEWLEAVGMDMPQTTDELRAVLEAFVNNDPTGTGRRTIGATGSPGGWGTSVFHFLLNAFTYAHPATQYLHVQNGTVFSSLHQPEFWDGMEFINGLVRDGLLEVEAFTQTTAELTAIAQQEDALAGMITAASYAGIFGGAHTPFKQRMTLMPPLTGPQGVNYTVASPHLPTHQWLITRSAEQPIVAFQLGEMFLSEYWALTFQHGPHGENWHSDPAVFGNWVGEFADMPVTYVVDPALNAWGRPGNLIWGTGPRYYSWPLIRGRGMVLREDFIERGGRVSNWSLHYQMYPSRYPEERLSRRLNSESEIQELAMIQPILISHIDSQLAEFAVGSRPLSEYAAFLQELEALGLPRFIQLAQNGHNRINGLPIPY